MASWSTIAAPLSALVLTAGPLFAQQPPPATASDPPWTDVGVPGDKPIEVVPGPPDSPFVIIYMHGLCGNPFAFRSWWQAAARHGTLVSLRGDEPCKQPGKPPGRTEWSYDYTAIDRRIVAAIATASEARVRLDAHAVPLDDANVGLIGYSQGARRAESMAQRFPHRYRRVALIAQMNEPSTETLHATERVLLMAGALDRRDHIRAAADKLLRAGVDVRFELLPGAHHGDYGPEADKVMARALDWLYRKVP